MSDERRSVVIDDKAAVLFPEQTVEDLKSVGPRVRSSHEETDREMAEKLFPEMSALIRKREEAHDDEARKWARSIEEKLGIRNEDGERVDGLESTNDKGSESRQDGEFHPDLSSEAKELFGGFEVPEGYELDPNTANEFAEIASDLGLDSDGAAKLVKLDYERQLAQYDAQENTVEAWTRETQKQYTHREIEAASKVFDRLVDDELCHMIAASGLGSHPGLVGLFVQIAKKGGL